MRTIIVDDEPLMLKSFMRFSEGITALEIVGSFQFPEEALAYARTHQVDLAILDIEMPGMNGIELATALRRVRRDMMIVFITAFEDYIRESNQLGVDYYIMKPYKRDTIVTMAERMQLLSRRLRKSVYVRTFGQFTILKDGKAVPIYGRGKEILALVITRRGKEISNEEIYSTIWEDREYDNIHMKVYYNAIARLREKMAKCGIGEILKSTTRGQMANTELFDCDFYDWLDNRSGDDSFDGEFLSEFGWAESILGWMIGKDEES